MGQKGEVIRANRKMETILCVDIFAYLTVEGSYRLCGSSE